jgi:hypothetical protein
METWTVTDYKGTLGVVLHSAHRLGRALVEGLDAVDVLLGAQEDGAALVDLARLQVQNCARAAGDRAAAAVFHQERHRIALRMCRSQLALGGRWTFLPLSTNIAPLNVKGSNCEC